MTVTWRSLLYVPTHIDKFVDSPKLAEADAVILDLEDSVPADHKAQARGQLAGAVTKVVAAGPSVLVRINDGALADDDIAAAIQPGVAALVIPKVRSVDQLKRLDDCVSDAEIRGGLAESQIRFLVLIETADGFMAMPDILRCSRRTIGVNLGAEDFAADVGMVADAATLRGPRQQVVIAAAATGVAPFGLMGATTRFDDLVAYRELAEESKRFGYVGSTCIHPSQVAVLNAAFLPGPDDVVWAQRVCAAFEAATREGRGAVALEGRMIDAPVAARAETLLARHAAIQSKTATKQGGLERAR